MPLQSYDSRESKAVILFLLALAASVIAFAPLSSAQSNVLIATRNSSNTPYIITQNITGSSSFVMASNSASIYLNSSLALPFSVALKSGTPGTTYLVIANGNELAEKGIFVGMNPSNGIPTFGGTLYINTNLNPGVVPGIYKLKIESGGSDPIYPGVYNLTLTVYNTVAPPSTLSTSTVITTSYSVTSAPQTTVKQKSASLLSVGTGWIIVILVIVMIVFLAIGARRRNRD